MAVEINKKIFHICSQIKKRGQDVNAFKDLHIGIIQVLFIAIREIIVGLQDPDYIHLVPFVHVQVDYDRMENFLGENSRKYEKLLAEMMKLRY